MRVPIDAFIQNTKHKTYVMILSTTYNISMKFVLYMERRATTRIDVDIELGLV